MSSIFTAIRERVSVKAIYAVVLLLIFGVALVLRVCLPYDNVFVGDWVRFGLNDPWYHMRLVDNLVQHFPQYISFDPYTHYPFGIDAPFAPFFDLLLGFVIWVIGVGSPTQHTVEVVGAFFPAVLGALVTVPVYFIGRELFSRPVGLLSAALVAILPGEFLFRSLLGFTDHHVAEVLFSTTAALFLIMAIRRANEKEITFGHLWRRDWRSSLKPLIYSVLTGIALGVYLLSWVGGLLFVFIVAAYILIQYLIDHLKGKATDYLSIVAVPAFLIALVIVAPSQYPPSLGKGPVVISLLVGVVAFLGSSGLSRLVTYRNMKPFFYPLGLVVAGAAGVGIFYAIDPSLLSFLLERFQIFTPSTATRTISEVQPLLSSQFGGFSLSTAWNYFTTGFFIALVSLLALLALTVYQVVTKKDVDKTFLIVWSLVILAATLSQRRFAYYYAVNVAILCGYLSWAVLEWTGLGALGRAPKGDNGEPREDERRKKGREKKRAARRRAAPRKPLGAYVKYIFPAVAAVVVFFAVFFPSILVAPKLASNPSGPDDAWHSSLVWLRENTPEPFGDPDFYYEAYEHPPPGEWYDYPESAYSVMSWWDYGHWITRIAHRIPRANPFQKGAREAARFFTAQDEAAASDLLDREGSKYVVIDYPMSTYKFYAMPIWLGESQERYFEDYHWRGSDGVLRLGRVFYPEYYQTMCSRLFNFGGQAVTPDHSTWVISYVEKRDEQGQVYKEISAVANNGEPFATYEEALSFLGNQTTPNWRIIGAHEFASPVPLEALEHFKLVHQSTEGVALPGDEAVAFVRIFEYSP